MKTRDIVIIGLFIALAYLLGFVKFYGSMALDSTPAFLAVFLFKDYKGAIIGAVGHLLSASGAGFYFTLPVHIGIAILMFAMLYIASFLVKKFNTLLAIGFIFIINTFVLPVVTFIAFPIESYPLFVTTLAPVTILNLIVAALLIRPIRRVLNLNETN